VGSLFTSKAVVEMTVPARRDAGPLGAVFGVPVAWGPGERDRRADAPRPWFREGVSNHGEPVGVVFPALMTIGLLVRRCARSLESVTPKLPTEYVPGGSCT